MELIIRHRVEFVSVSFDSARGAASNSFIVQKSLNHLDLSTCEYSLRQERIFTEEQFRKKYTPKRQILYTLNLDLLQNIESSLRTANPALIEKLRYRTFNIGAVYVSECVYNGNLKNYIVTNILLAENKVEKLKRYLKVIKILKLDQCRDTAVFLFHELIFVLYPFCMNSTLVMEFAISLKFSVWMYKKDMPDIVDYILHHALLMNCKVLEMSRGAVDPFEGCIIFHQIGNLRTLLEYGFLSSHHPDVYIHILYNILGFENTERLFRKNIQRHRLFLLIQFSCYLWLNHADATREGLLRFWRAIPDRSFTKNEIIFLFKDVIPSGSVNRLIENYKRFIVEETEDIDDSAPRPLQHLCRVSIRNILSSNRQLPLGIDRLRLPPLLRNYLNLKC